MVCSAASAQGCSGRYCVACAVGSGCLHRDRDERFSPSSGGQRDIRDAQLEDARGLQGQVLFEDAQARLAAMLAGVGECSSRWYFK
eukprot:11601084-Alexandrium_andersonii.AAC.1